MGVPATKTMFVWAGEGCPSDVLESFNVFSLAWQKSRKLKNQSLPKELSRPLSGMAVASDGNLKVYCFGGLADGSRHSSLYCVDFSTMEIKKISAAASPTPREDSAMIYFRQTLVLYGGDTGGFSASDDLFVFDFDKSEDSSVNDV